MKLVIAVTLALSFAVIGCQQEKKETLLTYDFDENGCKTGAHSFGSKAEYCAGLKDDVLNNGCAYSTRKAEYEQNCGTDWAFWGELPADNQTAAQ